MPHVADPRELPQTKAFWASPKAFWTSIVTKSLQSSEIQDLPLLFCYYTRGIMALRLGGGQRAGWVSYPSGPLAFRGLGQ